MRTAIAWSRRLVWRALKKYVEAITYRLRYPISNSKFGKTQPGPGSNHQKLSSRH
jgi:hypothetical protein